MGNSSSVQLDGEQGSVSVTHQALDMSIQGSPKSWATIDNTVSGPWSFLVKEEVQCLCEGGRNCSHENPSRQQATSPIMGLHSSWVGEHVLAMARPWQENVLKHDVVSQFKQHNIGMILNLQEVGEHESCGPGNLSVSGFTYNPETFMAAKIGVYNISWRDMGVPTLEKMMDIVQIMQYTTAVECRKVAVHCHAGLGRTGLAIACFLLASGQANNATKAVEMVRACRPGSLQTQAQVIFVSIFEQYLQHLRCSFKVADLKHLSLGNTNYIVTKVCRRISRSLSGAQSSTAGTPDAFAAAAAALGPLAFTPTGSGGSGVSSSAPGSATAAAAAQAQPDWTSATYDIMTPTEAAQLAATPAEAAANAALNLGAAGAVAGQEGVVMHARRLSGGGAMKMVSNLKAIEEEGDKPVHVIQTDSAVTEVYGHGLTIIRATDSVKKMYTSPAGLKSPRQQVAEQQVPTTHDLGLDKQLPWNEKFGIKPEAFKAEGWLPEPPASYLEALRRQQRLLHGNERRRCLHQHKLLRSAAKALAAAAETYKAVPAHNDAIPVPQPAPAVASPMPFKRMHSRSRSNASAIDLLAVTCSPTSSGIPPHDLLRVPSGNSSAAAAGGGSPAAAGIVPAGSSSPGGSLLSKQQLQQSSSSAGGASAAGGSAQPDCAAALLPGLQLGPPGSITPTTSSAGAASNSSPGVRGLSKQGSSIKRAGSPAPAVRAAPAPGGSPAAAGGFFLLYNASDGSPTAAAAPGCAQPSCTPCLAGCCAPSFVVGLLIALLYKGRFPEEYEAQWAGCPRLKALGLDEGHAVCQALQDVKLAVNTGSYGPLESASGAVAVCVLADWFEVFTEEAFTESTLELLVDDAESLLAEALAAAAVARAQKGKQQQMQQQQEARSSLGPSSSSCLPAHLPPLNIPASTQATDKGGSSAQAQDDEATLARKKAARSMCSALAPYEQDLCLLLAAVLRHARHASLDDPRLQELGLNYSSNGSSAGGPSGSGRLSGGGAAGSGVGSGQQAAAVEAEVDAAMAVLYRLVAGWLLGPLALACVPALEAVAAFLHYLTVDDTAYRCLLQAIQQGVRRARSAPAGKGSLWDLDNSNPNSAPSSPRGQQQQNMDRLEKLKARLLVAGSSFKLKPLSTYYKQLKHSQQQQQQEPAAGPGSVRFAEQPGALPGALPATGLPVPAVGGGVGPGAAAGAIPAQHSLGKSKLRHASSSPDLCDLQQQQQQGPHFPHPPGSPARHMKSKLGAASSAAALTTTADAPSSSSPRVSSSVDSAGVHDSQVMGSSPPGPAGCGASWTSMLSHTLHSLSSKKHQPPPLEDPPQQSAAVGPLVAAASARQGKQQAGSALAAPAAPAAEPKAIPAPPALHSLYQPQQPGQQQQQPMSPSSVASSSCGDSMSEVIHAGNCQQLCVGQAGRQGAAAGSMEDDLVLLSGHRQTGLVTGGSMEGPGVLELPPRSMSPELPSPRTAARLAAGRSSKQHPVHMRLPAMPHSSLDAGSDMDGSFTGSPCSSMGSIAGLLLGAQMHQQYQLQQSTPPAAIAAAAGGVGGAVPDSTAAGAKSVRSSGCREAGMSVQRVSTELANSQTVSVSAMSDLQMQSSASSVATSLPSSRTRRSR